MIPNAFWAMGVGLSTARREDPARDHLGIVHVAQDSHRALMSPFGHGMRYLTWGTPRLFQERRSKVRRPADELATVTPLQPSSRHPALEGRLLNESTHGVQLALSVALESGIPIRIRLRDYVLMAEVRYCIPVGDEFRVGARILSGVPVEAPKCP